MTDNRIPLTSRGRRNVAHAMYRAAEVGDVPRVNALMRLLRNSRRPRQGEWILPAYALPDSVEAIEAGRPQPIRPKPDDSREGRWARLLADPSAFP